jgi:hypothetical protein
MPPRWTRRCSDTGGHIDSLLSQILNGSFPDAIKRIDSCSGLSFHHFPGHIEDSRKIFAVLEDGFPRMTGNGTVDLRTAGVDDPGVAVITDPNLFQKSLRQLVEREQTSDRSIEGFAVEDRDMKGNGLFP